MRSIPKTKAVFERLDSFRAGIPTVTLVEHMTDPRAAQLQMMFASLDERGKKTLMAMAAAMVKLHKDQNHG